MAEETLGDKRYRFEKILMQERTKWSIAFSAISNRTRIAYGFSRDLFKAAGSLD